VRFRERRGCGGVRLGLAAPCALGLALAAPAAAPGDILVADQSAFAGPGGVIGVNPATGARTTLSENTTPTDEPSFAEPSGIAVEPPPPPPPPPTTPPGAPALAGSQPPGAALLPPDQGLVNCATAIKAGKDGTLKLCDATNPPTAATTQTLTGTLPTAKALAAKTRKPRKKKPKNLTLATGQTTIPAGETRPVTVKLTAQAKKALLKRGRLAVQVTIEAQGPGGQNVTVKRTLTLTATKKKSSKRRKKR